MAGSWAEWAAWNKPVWGHIFPLGDGAREEGVAGSIFCGVGAAAEGDSGYDYGLEGVVAFTKN